LFTAAAALVRVPESFFQLYPLEAQVVMASLADASDLLRVLLNGGHSAKAGYLADRKSTRLNSSHVSISYAVFCLKKKKKNQIIYTIKQPTFTDFAHTTEINFL